MKKFEVKKIGVKSMFKVTLYMMVIPAIFMLIAGIVILSFSSLDSGFRTVGIIYLLFPILIVAIYGPLAMLMAWIYNVLAKKFGGLKLELSKSKKGDVADLIEAEKAE